MIPKLQNCQNLRRKRGIFVIVCGICRGVDKMLFSKCWYWYKKTGKCSTKIKPVLPLLQCGGAWETFHLEKKTTSSQPPTSFLICLWGNVALLSLSKCYSFFLMSGQIYSLPLRCHVWWLPIFSSEKDIISPFDYIVGDSFWHFFTFAEIKQCFFLGIPLRDGPKIFKATIL